MKKIAIPVLLVFAFGAAFAQPASMPFEKATVEAQLRYIASDELAGRRTGSQGGQLAADYIANEFQRYGIKQLPSLSGFFQLVPFENILPATTGALTIGGQQFLLNENLLALKGGAVNLKSKAVFANFGWADEAKGLDDYRSLDVKGKIVFVLPGTPDGQGPGEIIAAMSRKQELAKSHGAAALIELYRINLPWSFFKSYFGGQRLQLAENQTNGNVGGEMFYGWLKEEKPNPIKGLEAGEQLDALLECDGTKSQPISAHNVVGFLEGTDPMLKSEIVVISAHYDHVGVGKEGKAAYTPQDSIFNGARDNGMGTVALLSAAKYLAANPPKRSVAFLACTGEELGLLGSAYFVEHPPLDLNRVVFNLNNDGAGYNSTAHCTVIGLGLTNMDGLLEKGTAGIGLGLTGDPAPEQGLYERSDNFSFVKKGIPAVDYAPGITGMDEAVFKYYHQAIDNPDTIDYDYLLKFCQAFAYTAGLISNFEGKIEWAADSIYKQGK